MIAKSVNISQTERYQIKEKVKSHFLRAATVRHPNPGFGIALSKNIVESNFKRWEGKIENSETKDLYEYVSPSRLVNRLAYMSLPKDLFIYALISDYDKTNALLSRTSNFFDIDEADIVIPKEMLKEGNDKLVLNIFVDSVKNTNEISEEWEEKINGFNEQMETIYLELSSQLTTVLTLIDTCKTTKQFEIKLPALINMYPPSVVKKLDKKNNEDEELTEEQKLINSAMGMIATGKILSSSDTQ